MSIKRLNISDLQSKKNQEKIACLTAYTAPFAKIMDKYVDVILVGDSLGMVVYGMENTLSVTVDMMIAHGRAVVKNSGHAFVVVDMPFGSYQGSKEQAFNNAARIIAETGCQAVKVEGGEEIADTIKFLVSHGIAVVGHVGLMPQKVGLYGGYPVQGKSDAEKKIIMADSVAVEKAGAIAVVIEKVQEKIAADVTRKLKIPTIGIGASPKCDGQIVVTEDMAGLFTDFKPKFVKTYGNLANVLENSVKEYVSEVKSVKFPSKEHCF